MSIPQSDILLLNVIKQGLSDLRKHPFLIDFIFEYTKLPIVNLSYGQKELERAKMWFLQNYIEVGFEWSFDQARYPSIVISHTSSIENESMGILGDTDMGSEEYIDKKNIELEPIYIAGPFSVSYEMNTGIVTLPNSFIEYPFIFPGQGLVSKKSNTTYKILEIISNNQFKIEKNVRDDFTESYINPQFNQLKVIRNILHFNENYILECRVSGETAAIIWLHNILLYVLLKNRMLLEQNTFSISSVSSSGVSKESDEAHGSNIIFAKSINLKALVQCRWVEELSYQYEGLTMDLNLVKINDPTKTVYAHLLKT